MPKFKVFPQSSYYEVLEARTATEALKNYVEDAWAGLEIIPRRPTWEEAVDYIDNINPMHAKVCPVREDKCEQFVILEWAGGKVFHWKKKYQI